MTVTELQAPGSEGAESAKPCPTCGALWVRMGQRKKTEVHIIYPEGGWIPLIRSSIQEVFEIMLGCETGPGVSTAPDASADLTAVIGLAGQLTGMMSIRCNQKAACAMASAMLGMEITEFNDDARDALGEVCNMVAGNFKSKIAGLADGCSLSVPTVISGTDYKLHPLALGERVIVSFSFSSAPIWVALDLHE